MGAQGDPQQPLFLRRKPLGQRCGSSGAGSGFLRAQECSPRPIALRTLFYSKSADAVLQCFVYTPPDYDKDVAKRYPVLYLQHGGGENETGWGQQGFTGRIMDKPDCRRQSQAFYHRDGEQLCSRREPARTGISSRRLHECDRRPRCNQQWPSSGGRWSGGTPVRLSVRSPKC